MLDRCPSCRTTLPLVVTVSDFAPVTCTSCGLTLPRCQVPLCSPETELRWLLRKHPPETQRAAQILRICRDVLEIRVPNSDERTTLWHFLPPMWDMVGQLARLDSRPEHRFLTLLQEMGVARLFEQKPQIIVPYTQSDGSIRPGPTWPDFVYRRDVRPVAVYIDGAAFHHRTLEQAERDREIDGALGRLGFLVERFTGREVISKPERVAARLRLALAAPRGGAGLAA